MKAIAGVFALTFNAIAAPIVQDTKIAMTDFVIPVTEKFVVCAATSRNVLGGDLVSDLKYMGISFPLGAKVRINNSKRVIIGRLRHDNALKLVKIINFCVENPPVETAKLFFGFDGLGKTTGKGKEDKAEQAAKAMNPIPQVFVVSGGSNQTWASGPLPFTLDRGRCLMDPGRLLGPHVARATCPPPIFTCPAGI